MVCASVYHSVHPSDRTAEVVKCDKRVVERINGVVVHTKKANEPKLTSLHGINDAAYHAVKSSIHAVLPDTLVVPFIIFYGGTDSRHFIDFTKNIYKFGPFVVDSERGDMERSRHGANERIEKSDLPKMIRFYLALFDLADRI